MHVWKDLLHAIQHADHGCAEYLFNWLNPSGQLIQALSERLMHGSRMQTRQFVRMISYLVIQDVSTNALLASALSTLTVSKHFGGPVQDAANWR